MVQRIADEPGFQPDEAKQRAALGLLLGSPQRGRVFVLRDGETVLGMVPYRLLL